MQFILLLFIVPSFALVGISSYIQGGNTDTLAKVAGEKISQQEFDEALRNQMDQMRQRFGNQFDEAVFNTPAVKESVLNNLIAQYVLKAEVKKAHLSVPDLVLQQTISGTPGLILADGSFDNEAYKRILAAQGMTPVMYESRLRQDLAQQQLINAVQGSAFPSKTLITQLNEIMGQEREVQSLHFNTADFVKQVNITDAMLKAYYDQNSVQFSIPEKVKIEYIVLNGDAIAAQMAVSDEDIKAYYDQNIKNYSIGEQRRASHILIKVDKKASAAEKAAAKAKAEEVLALVKKQPDHFAELARQYSQDEGSASAGGDLDYFSKGMMLKPFEDAAFKLKQNETSGLVESDFGFHIIHLTGIKPASVKPLTEVKEQIASEIKKQKASKKFSEMAETFTNTVYEQSNSLKPAADKLKLSIETADGLTRTPNPASGSASSANPVLTNPKFLKSLFSDDAIKNKRNTEALEVAPNTLVSARIVEYKPAGKHPFDEVKDVVMMHVKLAESEALATKTGHAKLAALQASPDDKGFAASKLVSRSQQSGIPASALDTIMKADAHKLPAFVGVSLPGEGYTIYRISKIQQAAVDPQRTADLTRQVESVLSSEDLFDFIQMLKKKDQVKIIKPVVPSPVNNVG